MKNNIEVDFSIIIVNYNSANYLAALIDEWLKIKSPNDLNNRPSWEIIIVENGSPNKEQEMKILNKKIEAKIKSDSSLIIKIIDLKKNLGFGGGNNFAAKEARGKWLFFLNADTLTNKEILVDIKNEIKTSTKNDHEPPLAIAPHLVIEDGKTSQKYSTGIFPGLKNTFLQKINLIKNVNKIDWISGAAMIIEKELFLKVDGFDENFFMYFEDVDLCKRLKMNYPERVIHKMNQSEVIHLGGKSIQINRQRYKLYFEAQDYYWQKHLNKKEIFLMRILRWPYKNYRLFFSK